jgi:hypothetical protein
MAKISLDHFFNVVCHATIADDDLLRKAIIHCVTTSSQYPRLRRAAIAWQPSTPAHRKFKRLMLAKDLQPLARDQLTPEVISLMRALQDWLRTNWYRKGEIPVGYKKDTMRAQRALLAQKRAMNVEQRRLKRG